MDFITYGNKQSPVIVFVHGSCTTAETCYQKVIEHLKKDYYCVLCKLDGHYDGSTDFLSLDDEAKQIETYIYDNFCGTVYGLIGLSLGSTICIRLLERNKSTVNKVILDGVYVQNKGWLYAGMCTWMCNAGIAYINKGGKVPDRLVEIVFGKGNKSVVKMMYEGVSKRSVRNVCHQVYRYKISNTLKENGRSIICVRGQYEPIPKKSYELLKSYLPAIQEIVIPACGHAQFLNEKPDEYVRLLYKLLN